MQLSSSVRLARHVLVGLVGDGHARQGKDVGVEVAVVEVSQPFRLAVLTAAGSPSAHRFSSKRAVVAVLLLLGAAEVLEGRTACRMQSHACSRSQSAV